MIEQQDLIDSLGAESIEFFDIKIHEDDDFLVIETEETTIDIDVLIEISHNYGTGLTIDYGEHGLDIFIYGIND